MTNSFNKFKNLADQVDIVNAVYDLSPTFQGPLTIARNNNESNTARLQLWINSEAGDSVGNPSRGGVVKNLLGKILNTDNLSYYESLIRERLSSDFEGEIEVLNVKLIPNKVARSLTVNVIAIDNLTGSVTSTTATTS